MRSPYSLPACIALSLAAALAACGPSSGGPGGDDDVVTAHLRIDPGAVTLTVDNNTPATQRYVVIAVGDDGSERDVTAEATLVLGTPGLGSFDHDLLTTASDRGGHAQVTATWTTLVGTASLTVLLRHTIVEPGAPADAPGRFGGATSGGAAPELVYPDTGVIAPPNLNTMEFHFRPASGQNLFELTFTGSTIQLAIYLTCTPLGTGCVWSPSQATWDILATAGRGDEPVAYTLRGLDGSASAPVAGASAAHTLQFSSDDVTGGIYYWNAGAGQIMRYDFGLRGGAAESFLTVAQTGATTCVGCHALSRDGSRIAVGMDIPGPASVSTLEVGTRAKLWSTASSQLPGFPSADGANFFTFSPDNQQLASSTGTNLVVRNAADGTAATTVVQNATMPDWSPAGDRLVFARAGQAVPVANPGVGKGSIVTVATGTWADEATLVASAGENNYYPAYAPDGEWVAFNRSANSDSFDQPDARVWVVNAHGGAPIQLAAASPTGGDSWPKWSPLPHSYVRGPVYWLTFSSRRAYGLRAGGTSQLWMVGFDPARAAAGLDPSFAAFWLPFQDPASGNHIAQWVEHVDRPPCDQGACAEGEICDPDGYCIPVVN